MEYTFTPVGRSKSSTRQKYAVRFGNKRFGFVTHSKRTGKLDITYVKHGAGLAVADAFYAEAR